MKGETLNINFSSLSLEIYLSLLSSVKNASNPEEKSTFLLISFLPLSININDMPEPRARENFSKQTIDNSLLS